jgi:Tol biopolymer transport system component
MSRRLALALVALAGLAGVLLGGFLAARRLAPVPETPDRLALSIPIPMDRELLDIAVSPDARRIAYTAVVDGRSRLYVRQAGRFDTRVVPDTEGASQPFFAPDGSAVGFFADGWLRTVWLGRIEGDEPDQGSDAGEGDRTVAICRVTGQPAGGAWDAGGRIVFGGPGTSGLQQVPATGGEPVALTVVDTANDETAHGWPHIVDERWILFTVGRHGRDPRLSLLDRETGETLPLLLADGGGWVVDPSTVVFVRRGEIFAARLDLDDGSERRGPPSPRPVLEGAAGSAAGHRGLGRSRFAAARDGTLVFVPPPSSGGGNRLVWVDRSGRSEPLDDVAAQHQTPRISPDGRRVAVSAVTAILRRDLWLLDPATGNRRQITGEAGDNHSPLWSHDGATLTFASSRTGLQRLFRVRTRSLDVFGPVLGGDLRTPGSWSPDGRRLAFHELDPDRLRDIWTWREAAGDPPTPWLATVANERAPAFSPDGRWIAYVSDADPHEGDQVYVRPADETGGAAIRITPAGGTEPVWAKAGGALFFRRGQGLYRVTLGEGATPVGAPEHLFDGGYLSDPPGNLPAYDTAPDGERFLMLELAGRAPIVHLFGGWQPTVFPPDRD